MCYAHLCNSAFSDIMLVAWNWPWWRIYTVEIGRCYKRGLPPLHSWLQVCHLCIGQRIPNFGVFPTASGCSFYFSQQRHKQYFSCFLNMETEAGRGWIACTKTGISKRRARLHGSSLCPSVHILPLSLPVRLGFRLHASANDPWAWLHLELPP